jgi:hypothetical protein
MTERGVILEKRFRMSMNRINGLVTLISSNDALKPTSVFGPSAGARADILRSIVVFLHATFEVSIRSYVPKPSSKGLYSRHDFDKALRRAGLDPAPFQSLYPPLTQMAKRRKQIVHDADLTRGGEPHEWSIADDWQLIMWLMAVPAFYYQLRMSLGLSNIVQQAMLDRLRLAMTSHVAFGKQLIAFPEVPKKLRIQALREVAVTLEGIGATLHFTPGDFSTADG